MATKEELLAEIQRRGLKVPDAQPQQGNVNQLLQQLAPRKQNVGTLAGDFLTRLGGGKPDTSSTDDLSKLYAQEAIKKQFDRKQAVITGLNPDGTPKYHYPPNDVDVKSVAPGLTDPYQQLAGSRADRAEIEASIMKALAEKYDLIPKGGQPGAQPQLNPPTQGQNPTGQVPPVGSTFSVGGMKVPLNPELTEGESRVFAANPTLNQQAQEIFRLVDSGVLERGGKDKVGSMLPNIAGLESATRGIGVDSGFAPLVQGDKELSELQSATNSLKSNIFFGEGGKSLTGTEKQVLENLLNVSGKDKVRIKRDISTAIQKYNEFMAQKRGGMYGGISQRPQESITAAPSLNPTDEQVGLDRFIIEEVN